MNEEIKEFLLAFEQRITERFDEKMSVLEDKIGSMEGKIGSMEGKIGSM